MNDVTDMRHRLAALVAPLPGCTKVTLGPSTLEGAAEFNFLIAKRVGQPSPENEEVIDELVRKVPDAVNADAGLSAFVTKCSGHRLYATPEGSELGCEWTVRVLI